MLQALEAVQGLAQSEVAYQNAVAYARERLQGRSISGVKAPDKPIEINLNVTIEQHVRVSIEKDVSQAIKKNKDIF